MVEEVGSGTVQRMAHLTFPGERRLAGSFPFQGGGVIKLAPLKALKLIAWRRVDF